MGVAAASAAADDADGEGVVFGVAPGIEAAQDQQARAQSGALQKVAALHF